MAVCESWIIRDGSIVIRDGEMLLCEDEVTPPIFTGQPGPGAGGILLPSEDPNRIRKRKLDIEVAAMLLRMRQ